jgi:hypothetical protein
MRRKIILDIFTIFCHSALNLNGGSKMEAWHKNLQSFANKVTFWIFTVNYPWNHPDAPANMGGAMLLTGDGCSIVRLKVIQGGKKYRLLQYKFKLMPHYNRKTNLPTDGGLLLRALQTHRWKQKWNEDISHKQLKEFMRLVGKIKCSSLKVAVFHYFLVRS